MDGLERYAIVISAKIEADEVSLGIDPSDLEAIEAQLNRALEGAESVGEEAGKGLAQGLEHGAVEALDLRTVLAKLRGLLRSEVSHLAKEEVVALKAALEHALSTNLDEGVRSRLTEAAKVLGKIVEAADANRNLEVKLSFNAEEAIRSITQRYLKSLEAELQNTLVGGILQKSGEEFKRLYLDLFGREVQARLREALRAGQPLSATILPNTQAVAQQAAIPTLKQALLLSGRPELVRKHIPRELENELKLLFSQASGTDWNFNNELVRARLKEIREAEAVRRKLFQTGLAREVQTPFSAQSGRYHHFELAEPSQDDKALFDRLLKLQDAVGSLSEEALARLTAQVKVYETLLATMEREANNPELMNAFRTAVRLGEKFRSGQQLTSREMKEALEAAKTIQNTDTYTILQGLRKLTVVSNTATGQVQEYAFAGNDKWFRAFADFAASMLQEKGEKFFAHPMRSSTLRGIEVAEGVVVSDRNLLIPRRGQKVHISPMRAATTYRTPTDKPIEFVVGSGLNLKSVGKEALGDGTIGIVRPETLGLPANYSGVVQVRLDLGTDEEALGVGKGTVVVSPKARESFINIDDLYIGGGTISTEEAKARVKALIEQGALKARLATHRVGTVEEAKIGKQVFLRHMWGVPFIPGRFDSKAVLDRVKQAKELGQLPQIINRAQGVTHYQQLVALAQSMGVEVPEGAYAMLAAHTAFKELDPELYRLLEGAEIGPEGELIVPMAIGKEMADRLGLEEGAITHALRNPVMGHLGALVKTRVVKVIPGFKGVVGNLEHLKSLGADVDGDTLTLLRRGLPVRSYPIEVFQTLMAASGLAGGRKGSGEKVSPSPGRLRFADDLQIYAAVEEELLKSKTEQAKRLKSLGLDLGNPFAVLRELETFGEEDLARWFKGRVIRAYVKAGFDKEEAKKRAFEFLDFRKHVEDPRRYYTSLPFYPSASVAANSLNLFPHKEEYDPNDPFALAAGQITTSYLGLTEQMAQRFETLFNREEVIQAIQEFNRASADDQEKAAERLRQVLNKYAVQKLGLANLLYQVVTDRKKRNYSIRREIEYNGQKAYAEYRNFYELLARDMDFDSVLPDRIVAQDGTVLEDYTRTKQATAKSALASLSKSGDALKDLKQYQDLHELIDAETTFDLSDDLSKYKPAKRELSFADITTYLYRGPISEEGLAETNLPWTSVQYRTHKLIENLLQAKKALEEGTVIGYEEEPEKRARMRALYKELVDEQLSLVSQAYREYVAYGLTRNAMKKSVFDKVKGGIKGIRTHQDFVRYMQRVGERMAKMDIVLEDDQKKIQEVLEEQLHQALIDEEFGITPKNVQSVEKALINAGILSSKKDYTGRLLASFFRPDTSLNFRVDLERSITDSEISNRLKEISDAEIRALTANLVNLNSQSFWADIPRYEPMVKRLAELLSEESDDAKRASALLAEAGVSSDVLWKALPPTYQEAWYNRAIRSKEYTTLIGGEIKTFGDYLRAVARPLFPRLGNTVPSVPMGRENGRLVARGYESLGNALLVPGRLQQGVATHSVEVLVPAEDALPKEAVGQLGRAKVKARLLGYADLQDDGKLVEWEKGRLARYQVVVEGASLGRSESGYLALLKQAVDQVLPGKRLPDDLLTRAAQANLKLVNEFVQAVRGATESPELTDAIKAVEVSAKAVDAVAQAVEEVLPEEVKPVVAEAKRTVEEHLKRAEEIVKAPVQPGLFEDVKPLLPEDIKRKQQQLEEARKRIVEQRVAEKEARIKAAKEAQEALFATADKVTGREPVDALTEQMQAIQLSKYAADGVLKGQYEEAKIVAEEAAKKGSGRVRKAMRFVADLPKVVRTVSSGGSGGTPPPDEPPAPPPPPDEPDDKGGRRLRYQASVFLADKQREFLKSRQELEGEFPWAVYKGMIRWMAEQELFRSIYLNSARGGKSGMPFDKFLIEYPEIANAFFGPLATFAGRETVLPDKYIKELSERFDTLLETYERGDLNAITELVEDLNIRAKSMENAQKILGDLREFKSTGYLPHARNLHTGARDALYYRRLMSIGGKELDRAVEEGDLDTILRIADRARHVEERIKLVQNAVSNSLAFMMSSVVMGFFGQLQQQFVNMDRQAKRLAALANMSGRGDIGQGLNQVARALNIGQDELIEAMRTLHKDGIDPEEVKNTFSRLGGVLDATGEGMQELTALVSKLSELGVKNPDEVIRSVVRKGVYLSSAYELIDQLRLKPGEVDQKDLDEILAAANVYRAKGLPLIIPEVGKDRERRLRELRELGARQKDVAKDALEPTALEKLLQQAQRTMTAIIEAAKPALAMLGAMLTGLLKVLETVAHILSTPLGKVAVIAGTIYATLLAIMQIQKTFQVGDWVRSLLSGLMELNGELIQFAKNIIKAFTNANFSGWREGPWGSLVDSLIGSLQSAVNHPKLKELGTRIGQAVSSGVAKAVDWLGAIGLDRFFKPSPLGIVDPSSAKLYEALKGRGGILGTGVGVLVAGAAGAYHLSNAQNMSFGQNLLTTLGNLALTASLFTPGGMAIRALAALFGGALSFGVPFMANRSAQAREARVVDDEFAKVMRLAGGKEGLARALVGDLTPALEKAGYTAESLGQTLQSAMEKGSGKVKNLAKEVKAMADGLAEGRRLLEGMEERTKARFQDYMDYLSLYNTKAYLSMPKDLAERLGGIMPGLFEFRPNREVAARGILENAKLWFAELFSMPEVFDPQAFAKLSALREMARERSVVEAMYRDMFRQTSKQYGGRGLEYGLLSGAVADLVQTFIPSARTGRASFGEVFRTIFAPTSVAFAGTGAVFGGPLGFLAGLLGAAVTSLLATVKILPSLNAYANLSTLRVLRRPEPWEAAGMAGAMALRDAEQDLIDAYQAAGLKKDAITYQALATMKGKDRLKAKQAIRDTLTSLQSTMDTLQERTRQRYFLKALGVDVEYDESSFSVSVGGLDYRRLRSRLPELQANLQEVESRLARLRATYAKYLDIVDIGGEIQVRNRLPGNVFAEAAFRDATERVKELSVEMARLRDELRQTRFAELLEQIALKAEKSFVKGLAESGYSVGSLLGMRMAKEPVLGFIEERIQAGFKESGLLDQRPTGRPDQVLSNIFGGRVTMTPGAFYPATALPFLPKELAAKPHAGFDIALPMGAPIKWGQEEGVVEFAAFSKEGWGNRVVVRLPDGRKVAYSHLQTIAVRPGQKLKPGQLLGTVGSTGNSTGPHLDLTVYDKDGRPVINAQEIAALMDRLYYGSSKPVYDQKDLGWLAEAQKLLKEYEERNLSRAVTERFAQAQARIQAAKKQLEEGSPKTSLENLLKLIEKENMELAEDRNVRKVMELAFILSNNRLPKDKQELDEFIQKYLKRSTEAFNLGKDLTLKQVDAANIYRSIQADLSNLEALTRYYRSNPEANLFVVQEERIRMEAEARRREIEARRESQLNRLKAERASGFISSDTEFKSRAEQIKAEADKSLKELELETKKRLDDLAYERFKFALEGSLVGVRNTRERIVKSLQAYERFRDANKKVLSQETMAQINADIERLKRELASLGPDFSKLVEAQIRKQLTSMLTGSNLPAPTMDLMAMAERVFNDTSLTTEQKLALGVNPNASGLNDLVLPNSLMGQALKAAKVAEAYAQTSVPKLQEYMNRLAGASIAGVAYLMESPAELVNLLRQKAGFMRGELLKSPEVDGLAKKLGVAQEALVGAMVQQIFGPVLQTAESLLRQAENNAMVLKELGVDNLLFPDQRFDFQKRVLQLKQTIEDLKKSPMIGDKDGLKEQVAQLELQLRQVAKEAPVLDSILTRYEALQKALFKMGVEGGASLEAQLKFANQVLETSGLSEESRFGVLRQLGVNPEALRRQLADLAFGRGTQFRQLVDQMAFRQAQIGLFERFGLFDALERDLELARLQTAMHTKKELMDLETEQRKALQDIAFMSTDELRATLSALGIDPEGVADLRKTAYEAVLNHFNRLADAIKLGAEQALAEQEFKILRSSLGADDLARKAEAAYKLLGNADFFKALSPQERLLVKQLEQLGLEESKLAEQALKLLADGMYREAGEAFGKVNSRVLEKIVGDTLKTLTASGLEDLLSSPYITDQIAGQTEFLNRLSASGLANTRLYQETLRQLNTNRASFAQQDLRRQLEDLSRSEAIRYGVGGMEAAYEVMKKQFDMVSANLLATLGLPGEILLGMKTEKLEELARNKNLTMDYVQSLVELFKQVGESVQNAERKLHEYRRFMPAKAVLREMDLAADRLAYSSAEERAKAYQSFYDRLDAAFNGLGYGVRPEDVLNMDPEELKRKLSIGEDTANELINLAKALNALAKTVREENLAAEISKLGNAMAQLDAAIKQAERRGTFDDILRARESRYAKTREMLNTKLAELGLAEKDLYLSDDELKARGLGDRLQLVNLLKQLRDSAYEDMAEILGMRLPVSLNPDELLKEYGLTREELMKAAPGTPNARLMESLLKHPMVQQAVQLGALERGFGLGRLAVEGDTAGIRQLLEKYLEGKPGLMALYNKGLDPASLAAVANVFGYDPYLQQYADAYHQAVNRKLARRMQEIESRYDAVAPLLGGPMASARLEILKLMEMYNAARQEEALAISEGDTAKASVFQKQAEALYEKLLDAQERYSLVIVREWNSMLGQMVDALKGGLKEAVSTLLREVVLGNRARQEAEIDRKYKDELEFTENELEQAKRRKEEIKAKLNEPGLSRAEREEYTRLLEYYTRKVEELEEKTRRVRFEWQQAKTELKSIAELLGEILNRIANALLDKFAGFVVDTMWDWLVAGAKGMASAQPSDAPSQTPTPQANNAVANAGSQMAVQSLSAAQAVSGSGNQGAGLSVAGIPAQAALGYFASGFSVGTQMTDGGNLIGLAGTALGQAGLGIMATQLAAGAGLGAAASTALSTLAGPVGLFILAGTAIGAFVDSATRAAEHLRKNALAGAYGTSDYGISGVRKGAHLRFGSTAIQVNVNAMDTMTVASVVRDTVSKELDKSKVKGGIREI